MGVQGLLHPQRGERCELRRLPGTIAQRTGRHLVERNSQQASVGDVQAGSGLVGVHRLLHAQHTEQPVLRGLRRPQGPFHAAQAQG